MNPVSDYDLSGTISRLFIHPIKSCACVLEAKPRDDKAIAELNSLLNALF